MMCFSKHSAKLRHFQRALSVYGALRRLCQFMSVSAVVVCVKLVYVVNISYLCITNQTNKDYEIKNKIRDCNGWWHECTYPQSMASSPRWENVFNGCTSYSAPPSSKSRWVHLPRAGHPRRWFLRSVTTRVTNDKWQMTNHLTVGEMLLII